MNALWKSLVRSVSPAVAITVVAVAVAGSGAIGVARYLRMRATRRGGTTATKAVSVPLWVEPSQVVHSSRFAFSFESAEAVADLRTSEDLDRVVAGAVNTEDAVRRLMRWTRAQWEVGRPDPYPPPDARVILRDIRSGRTGGFCAQYCVVLVQAIASFHGRARFVTIGDHEVIEAWLPDQQRWTMFDPTNETQVFGPGGRSLSALGVREAFLAGTSLTASVDNRLPESLASYAERFRELAFWLRNDMVSNPLNFSDIPRYRVWFEPTDELLAGQPDAAWTRFAIDLYP